MEFKWFKNGKVITMTQKSIIRTYTDFSVIFLEDVDQTSNGNYTCEVVSSSGSDSFTAHLEVKGKNSEFMQLIVFISLTIINGKLSIT